MNVLITSAGRRVSLLKAFRGACAQKGGKAFAADTDPLAPACVLADGAFRLPRVDAPGYAATLCDLVRVEGVRLVVPTIDTELKILSDLEEDLLAVGCVAVTSTRSFVEATADKWRTARLFSSLGIPAPRTWLPSEAAASLAELPDELIVKPRRGSASQGVLRVERAALQPAVRLAEDPIVQERLHGPEVTIDVLFGEDGCLLHYVPRVRVKAIGGESVIGRTIEDQPFRETLRSALAALGRAGARFVVTVQLFLTTRGPIFTEVNPRFGGGFPLGHAAGGLYPEWLVGWVDGTPPVLQLGDYRRDLAMTRYYSELFVPSVA